jgi:hypothetical protein
LGIGGLGLFAVGAVLLLGAVAPAAARANQLVDIAIPARNGELPKQWVVRYPGGDGPRAKVLLPDNYDPQKAYPLLVLLIGLQSHYSDWSDAGQGEIAKTPRTSRGSSSCPRAGTAGTRTGGTGASAAAPRGRATLLDQVIPQIQERYRIRPERRWHALAGVSMGGLGTAYPRQPAARVLRIDGRVLRVRRHPDHPRSSGRPRRRSPTPAQGVLPPIRSSSTARPAASTSAGTTRPKLVANLAHTRVFLTTGDGMPLVQDPGGILLGLGIVGQSEELGIIRPMSDSYAAALRAARVKVAYDSHPGNHDWNNFVAEFKAAVSWGLFEPVVERPAEWVYDTVATHGTAWDVGFHFDAPPDRVVRFQRDGDKLAIGAAGSPVTITTGGGCVAARRDAGCGRRPVAAVPRARVAAAPAGAHRGCLDARHGAGVTGEGGRGRALGIGAQAHRRAGCRPPAGLPAHTGAPAGTRERCVC